MNTPFNPNDLVSFMTNAGKTAAHNTAMKNAFKKLQASVNEFAAIFADEYTPVVKERTKRGEGRIAKKKAAATAAASAAKSEVTDMFTAKPATTTAASNKTATASPAIVPVVKVADQKK